MFKCKVLKYFCSIINYNVIIYIQGTGGWNTTIQFPAKAGYFSSLSHPNSMLGRVPVPTAWRVLGLRMEERPPAMEVTCEYIE
jgi:hypothetical protein